MAIRITCQCGKRIRAKDEYEGKRGICPACHREFLIVAAVADPVDSPVTAPKPKLSSQSGEPPPIPREATRMPRTFWKDPRKVAWTAFAIFAGFVLWIALPQLGRRKIDPGQKEAEAYIKSVTDQLIQNGGLPTAAKVKFMNVSSVGRNDPRKIPWLWEAYSTLRVPVSSRDGSGKEDETETVWRVLYQFDPRETNGTLITSGTLIWFETGHWIRPLARHHRETSEWTDTFRQQVRAAWSRQAESHIAFAGAKGRDEETFLKETADRHDRFCKQLNISPTELTEILDTFVAKKKPVYKAKIPADVAWRVLEEHFFGSDKRTIDVMLDGRVSKDVLGEIAKEVKSLEKKEYEITDVNFYIPDQDKKLGCWADSRDSPDMKFLRIVGFTAEEAEHLLKLPLDLPDGSEFIGCWLREEAVVNQRYAIYGLNCRQFLIYWYVNDADGSHRQTVELREYASTTGRRFKHENSSHFYEVEPDGTLRIYNEHGEPRGTLKTINPPLHTIMR